MSQGNGGVWDGWAPDDRDDRLEALEVQLQQINKMLNCIQISLEDARRYMPELRPDGCWRWRHVERYDRLTDRPICPN